jgi:Delta7-sterol 5-desaturase
MTIQDVFFTTVILTLAIAGRYLLVVWAAHALIWGRTGPARGRQLNRARPRMASIRYELKLSLLSSWIYALPAAVVFEAWRHGGTLVYLDIGRYGVAWLFVSGALYLVIQDTYYYWLHRLMHHRSVFRHVHAGHHRSREPTPFASFSFDWTEAALNAWLLPALTFVIPIHPIVIGVLLTLMTVLAVLNHAGAEVWPDRFIRGPAGGWLISATHHSLHHRRYDANFGLYFRVWDRLMGTDHMPAPAPAAAPPQPSRT